MTKLIQSPVAPPWTGTPRPVDKPADVTVRPRRQPSSLRPRDRIKGAGEFVLGWLLGVVIVAVQLVVYACAVLAVPLGPFLLPLGLIPAALLAALFILGIGRAITLLGVGQWWL